MQLVITALLKLGYPLEQVLVDVAMGILDPRYTSNQYETRVAKKLLTIRNEYCNAKEYVKTAQSNIPL